MNTATPGTATKNGKSPVCPGAALTSICLLIALGLAGCSLFEPVAEPSVPSPFEVGLARLADGDFGGADLTFRDLASRCESGAQGRRSLLFLSFMALDPRNPAAHPDSAALMAERFLNLPSKTLEETLEAEALYITALDYGADPDLRIDPANPGFAVRFGGCDQPFPPRSVRPLPTLESSTVGRLRVLGMEKDSLTVQNQQLRYTIRRLRVTSDSLQAQVDTLQAELTRIRQLIQLPDTSVVRRPPDTGVVRRPDQGSVRPSEAGLSRQPDPRLLRLSRAEPGPQLDPRLVPPVRNEPGRLFDAGPVRRPQVGVGPPLDPAGRRVPLAP